MAKRIATPDSDDESVKKRARKGDDSAQHEKKTKKSKSKPKKEESEDDEEDQLNEDEVSTFKKINKTLLIGELSLGSSLNENMAKRFVKASRIRSTRKE